MIVVVTTSGLGLVMQLRQIGRPTSFGPTELRVIFRAFDDAWGAIAPKVGSDPIAVETARMSLAMIVLGVAANTGPAAPAALTALAVEVFCRKRRIELGDEPAQRAADLGAQCLRRAGCRSSAICARAT
jgi:hypothetical protein